MKVPRMPQAHHLHPLLGLFHQIPAGYSTNIFERNIAAEGEADRVIRFQVLSAADADLMSKQRGNHNPGRGRPRIYAECDECGAWISCGRFNQHYSFHPKGGE